MIIFSPREDIEDLAPIRLGANISETLMFRNYKSRLKKHLLCVGDVFVENNIIYIIVTDIGRNRFFSWDSLSVLDPDEYRSAVILNDPVKTNLTPRFYVHNKDAKWVGNIYGHN